MATAELTDRDAIVDRYRRLRAEACRRSLHLFIQQFWAIVEPTQEFKDNPHIKILCTQFEHLIAGTSREQLINIPPGTMKTLIFCVFGPAWAWASDPSLRFFFGSYQSGRTIDAAGKMHDVVSSSEYQAFYPTRISSEVTHDSVTLSSGQDQKTRFETTKLGWVIASSVNGIGQGEHPDVIVIDDPISEVDSRSAAERKNVIDWFKGTISSRGVIRKVRVAVVMQRLHKEDLSGHLLAQGGWDHTCLPMRYVPSRAPTDQDPQGYRADPKDWRTKINELLWPSAYPEAEVRKLELKLGPYATAGQLQQQPAPEGGGLFKREWFKFVDVAPKIARRARGWDTAGTELDGDYTASCRMAEDNDLFYIEDVQNEQLGAAGVDALMRQTAEADGIGVVQREEKEPGGSGKYVVAAHLKLLKGYDYKHIEVTRDKVTRSKPFRAQVEGGNVYLVRGPWNERFISQLCDFPTGDHDDMVDAASAAFNSVLMEPKPEPLTLTW